MPARLSGSAPESEIQAPESGFLRTSRRMPTASGSANFSPENPAPEAPAADVAARLERAVDAQQLAPRRQPRRLALEQPPEHDAVAAQQAARQMLDRLGLGMGPRLLGRAARQRPAPGILHAEEGGAAAAAPPRVALAGRHEQRAQAAEAVGIDQALRHQLGQRLLGLPAQQPRRFD